MIPIISSSDPKDSPDGKMTDSEIGALEAQLRFCDEKLEELPDTHGSMAERVKLLYGRGYTFFNLGRFDKAVADLEVVSQLNPEYIDVWKFLGAGNFMLGNLEAAAADLGEAIRRDPYDPVSYANRASTHNLLGDYSLAIFDIHEALAIEPKGASLYNIQGQIKLSIGEFDRAIHDFETAMGLKPNDPSAYVNRGYAFNQMGLFDEASADLDEAIRLDPEDPGAFAIRGDTHRLMGDIVLAEQDYKHALETIDKVGGLVTLPHHLVAIRAERGLIKLGIGLDTEHKWERSALDNGILTQIILDKYFLHEK